MEKNSVKIYTIWGKSEKLPKNYRIFWEIWGTP
nr:MAG TPA: hypothetical protein [Caudoviricetes sp.]